jgi:hypothetical protein
VNNPASPASPTLGSIDPEIVDGMQALRTGLELARASQLTMLRLQLALHKSNRRTAMQTLDNLLDIDAEMEGLAAALTGAPTHLADGAALSDFIGRQKAAIAVEKHGLTGGHGRSEVKSMAIAAPSDLARGADLIAQPPLSADAVENDGRAGSRRWRHVFAVALIVTLIGFGLAAYLWPALPVTIVSAEFFG